MTDHPVLLNPAYAKPLTPQRPTDDGMGNPTWTDLPETPAVVIVKGHEHLPNGRGATFIARGLIFVPRDYDLKAGDRITWQATHFTVYGIPVGDMEHPMTGGDFGWKWYQIQGGR